MTALWFHIAKDITVKDNGDAVVVDSEDHVWQFDAKDLVGVWPTLEDDGTLVSFSAEFYGCIMDHRFTYTF